MVFRDFEGTSGSSATTSRGGLWGFQGLGVVEYRGLLCVHQDQFMPELRCCYKGVRSHRLSINQEERNSEGFQQHGKELCRSLRLFRLRALAV